MKVGGEWKYQPRLVSWYGPCDYAYSGLVMEKNLNWAPELLDLLHRLIGMTRHEFNSCFLNLYRHGWVRYYTDISTYCSKILFFCSWIPTFAFGEIKWYGGGDFNFFIFPEPFEIIFKILLVIPWLFSH